jgi:exopolysaccharide biosynthesis predicted pyruvyltransferase EpsI
MQTEFLLLEEIIRERCGRGPVYYWPNLGNWGDGLIRQGTIKFFRSIGLRYYEMSVNRNWIFRRLDRYLPRLFAGTLIYGGGGGWCHLWHNPPRLLESVNPIYRQVIVLPSTYEIRVELPHTIYFCRDRYQSKQVVPEAIFCHDMAFFLGKMPSETGQGVGYFLRTDKESAGIIKIPPDNLDISLQGDFISDVQPFFDALAKYSIIHTDRLHVAIAACLLGKELHFYPGAYFKNKAIFLSSMADIYPNVYFHEL